MVLFLELKTATLIFFLSLKAEEHTNFAKLQSANRHSGKRFVGPISLLDICGALASAPLWPTVTHSSLLWVDLQGFIFIVLSFQLYSPDIIVRFTPPRSFSCSCFTFYIIMFSLCHSLSLCVYVCLQHRHTHTHAELCFSQSWLGSGTQLLAETILTKIDYQREREKGRGRCMDTDGNREKCRRGKRAANRKWKERTW